MRLLLLLIVLLSPALSYGAQGGLLPKEFVYPGGKDNPLATTDPQPSNDSTQGYQRNSIWVNIAVNPPSIWQLADATAGNAKWVCIGGAGCTGGGGGASQNIEQVLAIGRIATILAGYVNRAQFGDASDRGTAMYSDGVISPSRITCIVNGVEDACDKVIGLKSGYKWAIQNEDGDDIISVAEDGTLTGFSAGSGYATVQDEGSNLTQRTTLNFTGAGVSCADNSGSSRTDCTISGGGGGSAVGARVNHSGSQSISHDAFTILAFDSERYDTNTLHDTSTNNSRITISAGAGAGKYLIGGSVRFNANSGTDPVGNRGIFIRLNGANDIARQQQPSVDPDEGGTNLSIATVYDLGVGDYVELRVYQYAGETLDVTVFENSSPEFFVHKLN